MEAFDLDHIIPLWRGGTDTDDNLPTLRVTCPGCHRVKSDRERQERVALGAAITGVVIQGGDSSGDQV